MRNHAQAAPCAQDSGATRARLIAHSLCEIAEATTWGHADWRALLADLVATDKPVDAITLGEVAQAITARREAAKAAA